MERKRGAVRKHSSTLSQFVQEISSAHEKAARLKHIVDEQKLSVKIGKSEHLRVEGWQTIGRGYGLTCKTEITELIRDAGKIVGVKGHADIIDTSSGQIVGGADSFCFGDEDTEDGKDGKSQQSVSQWAGMAQTRAESRAFKQVLSWVVILAGYSPTPAEEMTGSLSGNDMLLCPLHEAQWFKGGKMRDFAHVVEGETGPRGGKVWCNQEEVLSTLLHSVMTQAGRLEWAKEAVQDLSLELFGKGEWKQLTPVEQMTLAERMEGIGHRIRTLTSDMPDSTMTDKHT